MYTGSLWFDVDGEGQKNVGYLVATGREVMTSIGWGCIDGKVLQETKKQIWLNADARR
jgi:hypothetical protein